MHPLVADIKAIAERNRARAALARRRRTNEEKDVGLDGNSLDKVGVAFSLAAVIVVVLAAVILRSHPDFSPLIDTTTVVSATIGR
jgi:hypothetical protein